MNKSNPNIIEHDTFILDSRTTAPEIYVEGWSQLLIGYPMTKITFHTTVEPANNDHKELRRTATTISMPLAIAVQLAQTILAGCKSAESQIVGAATEATAQLKQMLSLQAEITMPIGTTQATSTPKVGS